MRRLTVILGLLAIVAVLFAFCEVCARIDRKIVKNGVKDHEVVVLDGCEYILVYGYNRIALAHKGNCTNHIRPRAIITTGNR